MIALDQRTEAPRLFVDEWSACLVNMDLSSYHDNLSHDSPSSIKLFDHSPGTYYHTRITGRMAPKADTDKQRLGSVMHTSMLEPERFADLVEVIPCDVLAKDGAKKGGKWDEWEEAHPGKELIKRAEYDAIQWMIENVWANPAAREILERATVFEHSIFWTDSHGNNRKARFDAVLELEGEFVDLKSSCNPGPLWWKELKKLGTHRQAQWYQSAYEAYYGVRPVAKHIVIGNAPPYDCYVWIIPQEALEVGREQNAESLRKLAACKRSDVWVHDFHGRENPLEIPRYWYPALDDYPEE